MLILLILWLTLIFLGISKNDSAQCPFSKEQATALRGICAVEIMLGHIGLATGSVVLYPNKKAGILFVGIFFALSGYGVVYSTAHKEDYLRNFLAVRLVRMLLPVYFIKLIMMGSEYYVGRCLGRTYAGISCEEFFFRHNWYVWEQLAFYLIYWLAYKILPKYAEIIVGMVSLAFIAAAFMAGMDNPWYGSSLCFVLGMYYYRFEKSRCDTIIIGRRKNVFYSRVMYYIVIAAAMFVMAIAIVAYVFLGNESILGNPVARNTASILFCVVIIMLLSKYKIGNAASRFLGKCSYEIFLLHPYLLVILQQFSFVSIVWFGILTVILSIVLAYVVHWGLERCLMRLCG